MLSVKSTTSSRSLTCQFFKDVLTKFLVKITVSDNLENMRLHVRAIEPEGDVSRRLSFKADDENFVGKKLRHVEISINK